MVDYMKASGLPMDRLYEEGFLSCRQHKRNTAEYMDFALHLVDWLPALRNSVLYETYMPDPLCTFLVYLPVLIYLWMVLFVAGCFGGFRWIG